MTHSRSQSIVMDGYGSYLGMEKGCFVLKDKKGEVERYPLFEKQLKEVVLRSGNMVSTGALASLGFWDVDTLILTQRGRPVAMLKSFDDDSHVKTRLCQYEAYHNEKGLEIAKQLVLSKIESQNMILEKYDLKPHDLEALRSKVYSLKTSEPDSFRMKLTGIEGKYTENYFRQIFLLIPKELRRARDGDSVSLNTDRCIGCGLCVSTCQGGALTLERKLGLEQTEIPDTFSDTWRTIALDRLNVKRN